jgi:hypothetical protein
MRGFDEERRYADMSSDTYSVAVLPFLKTRRPVSIGGLTFRPTDNVDGLPRQQAESVTDLASMLFLKDDLRIRSGSYAVAPFVDLNDRSPDVSHLSNIHATIAYLYASPHPTLGDVFLSSEHASMTIFSPGQVSIYLVRPTFHVVSTDNHREVLGDKMGNVKGYSGLYNFRHRFWVTSGSRVYGPQPHLTLNLAQDLSGDIERAATESPYFGLLFRLLDRAVTESALRIFTALRWFNAANREAIDDDGAIVNLAIAFEALLALPQAEKTDRLVDAISLLLGRIPRLDVWARQFYEARSQIVHEGRAQQLRFLATDSRKGTDGAIYQSLLTYGRQVFRLCLGTLLMGAEMAEQAGLEEKLVTNHERFQEACKVLADETVAPCERLAQIDALVSAVERYKFVAEGGLKLETMVGAVRRAAKAILACDNSLSHEAKDALEALVAAKRGDDHFEELEAIRGLDSVFPETAGRSETRYTAIVRRLVKVVWDHVFMHYFWLKERGSKQPPNA